MKTCVILAGGKSSRMGRDKTLLPFGGFATLTHYGAHKFGRIFERVFVSSKFEKFDPPLPLIKDADAKEISQLNLARAYEKKVNLQEPRAKRIKARSKTAMRSRCALKFQKSRRLTIMRAKRRIFHIATMIRRNRKLEFYRKIFQI